MSKTLLEKSLVISAKKLLNKYALCDNCLGRFFYKLINGEDNKTRAEILRKELGIKKTISPKKCYLCEGVTGEIQKYFNLIENALKDYEFDTFLIGAKIDEEIVDKENEINNFLKTKNSDSLKNEINRELGKKLERSLKKEVNFEKPTIMAIIDTSFDHVILQIEPLFVYGRYKKFVRDAPQTIWFCKVCKGKGCKRCNYSGKVYSTSIEEAISSILLEKTKGDSESFHGCGREDIDARMLGTGRPFILEIKNPKKRNIDLKLVEKQINKKFLGNIEVTNLRYSDRTEIVRIKNAGFRKVYHVIFKGEDIINIEKLKKAVLALQDARIGQLTPSRVAHRRADMVREKHIYMCKIESVEGSIATLEVEAESGTYIKELISGDNGRTKPSISELLGTPCKVTELDVIEIKGE